MLKINRGQKTLAKLPQIRLQDAGIQERLDLQRMIRNSPEAFFEEMGEPFLLIGEEIRPDATVEDRIDLLALDRDGVATIFELKRNNDKLQLLQALSYAAMVAKWDQARFVEELGKFVGKTPEDAEDGIEQFIATGFDSLNQTQRIILIAENFDYEVLVTAEWLTEHYGVDIRCYRVGLAKENADEFLTLTCIYPAPEISAHAIQRRRRTESSPKGWGDWETALEKIENKSLVDFFKAELASGGDGYLRKRQIYYSIKDDRRFFMAARQKHAYVWQYARFDGDLDFWNRKIGSHIRAEQVNGDTALRFFLASAEDFRKFKDAVVKDLQSVEFLSSSSEGASEVD